MDIAFAAAGAIAILGFAVYSLRFIYDYRLGSDVVDVVLFGAIPIYRIPVADIQSIKVVTWRESGFPSLRFGNRLTLDNMVLIEWRGLPRRVVITPADPHDFVARVARLRLASRPAGSFNPEPVRGSD